MKPLFNWRTAFVLVLAIVASRSSSCADEWLFVRGDIFGTGVARSSVPPAPELRWKYSAGKDVGFDATAVIVNGVIYLGDNAGTFHAVGLAEGKKVWTKEFADTAFGAGAAIEKDRLYVGDMNGAIYCLATADGAVQWNKKLEGEVHAGPTLNGEDVLFTCESGALSCRNKQNGDERWQFHIEAPLRCTPTIANGLAALAGCDSQLHIIDVSNGKETNSIEIDAPTGSTPAMRDDRVYFGTEGGSFYSIAIPDDKNSKPAVAWTYRDRQRNQPIRAAAAVTDQIVVVGGQGKAIYGLDPKSGDQRWKLPIKARVESSPVITGSNVVVATTAGKIYLLDIATGGVKWEFEAGGSFIASPAVVDGQIILGNSDGTLYCFGAKDGQKKN